MKKILIFILFSIIQVSLSKITYSLHSAPSHPPQSPSSTAFDLIVEDQVGIFQTQNLQILGIQIKSSNRLKREAYEGLNKKKNEVGRILKSLLVVPDSSMIRVSKIRQLFSDKKRKWEFRMVLTLCIFSQERREVIERLQRSLKIEQVKATLIDEQHILQKQLLILAKYQLMKRNAEYFLNSKLGSEYHFNELTEYNFQISPSTNNARHKFNSLNDAGDQKYQEWLRQVEQIEILKMNYKFVADTVPLGDNKESEDEIGEGLEKESEDARSDSEQVSSSWEQELIN